MNIKSIKLKPAKKKCGYADVCRNGGDGCFTHEPSKCVRFLPIKGTNLTHIDMVIETPPDIDYDKCSQIFSNWVESLGWSVCGSANPYKETE